MKWNVYLNLLNDLVTQIPGTYENRQALIEANIGKARLYGSDCSVQYNYNSWSSVYFNASYTMGKDNLNDLYLPQIPPLNGVLGLNITRFDYQLAVSANIFTAQNKIAPGEISTPEYAYFNTFIRSPSFKTGFTDCRILGGVQNLTGKSYRNHLSTNSGFIREEPGRNFYLKLNISW